jgi:hypothetical protein
MKMRRTMGMLALLAAGLSACNDKPGDKAGDIAATDAMSKQAVKEQVDKVQLKPGQWEGRFTVQDIDMPQAPAGVEEHMKGLMNQNAYKYCVTSEQAANPSGEMFAGQGNKDCTYGGFEAKAGKVKGQVSCKAQNGVMNAAMSGTYAPENFTMDMDMKMEGLAQGMTMAMTARSAGKWIGPDCAEQH